MIPKKNWLLYTTFAFTCLEDRAWPFFSPVILQSLGGMRFVSIGQFSESLIQMVLSGFVGRLIDRNSRKNSICLVVLSNNLAILFAVLSFFISLQLSSSLVFLYISVAFCAINRLFLNAEKSIISRDWIMILCDDDERKLSRENATLTTLDQLVNIVAPIFVGALSTSFGMLITLVTFGIGSIVSLICKFTLLYIIYQSNETLHYKSKLRNSNEASLCTEEKKKPQGVFKTYLVQYTFYAALGMALFYKTVMGFDNLAVGYASNSSNLSVFTIGMLRAYGSLAGMMGAISYSIFEKRVGLIKAGIIGMIVQQACSLLAVVSIFMPGSPMIGAVSDGGYSVPLFLISIATARFGLWCVDLAVTHSMQIHVPEYERNTVFGVHMALCQAFSVPKEMLVILFPEPSRFWIYILASYFFVVFGEILFCCYARKTRK